MHGVHVLAPRVVVAGDVDALLERSEAVGAYGCREVNRTVDNGVLYSGGLCAECKETFSNTHTACEGWLTHGDAALCCRACERASVRPDGRGG